MANFFAFSSSTDYRNPCFSYIYSRLSLLSVSVATASNLQGDEMPIKKKGRKRISAMLAEN